ncbi:MAG: DUF177 domain-containing protein [Clostridia bacterium]|nr:DUF177 domain-containing protein [Clostridia bacterium]
MILDLNAIKRSGKTQADFFFEYDTDITVDIPQVKMLSPVKVQGRVFLATDGTAEVEGETVFTLKGECTRCLEDTEKTFTAEFCESCGIPDGYPIVNGKIDIKKIVDDAIIINIPVVFLCREDCKGLCHVCGANLNDGGCKCNNK